ncbi:unnamed protein product, partial [Ectocarpus sp. 12 AP-2014]
SNGAWPKSSREEKQKQYQPPVSRQRKLGITFHAAHPACLSWVKRSSFQTPARRLQSIELRPKCHPALLRRGRASWLLPWGSRVSDAVTGLPLPDAVAGLPLPDAVAGLPLPDAVAGLPL